MNRDLREIFIDEIYTTPPHKNHETNKAKIRSIDVTCSLDILDLNDYAPENNEGFGYILVVIDNFSKFRWTVPLKNKKSQSKTHFLKTFSSPPKEKRN